MPRHASTRGLDKRTSRLRLPVARKPTFVTAGPGVSIGYRRNNGAGTWVARVADGAGGSWTKAVGNADDFADADGAAVLDFWQASARARSLARPAGEEDAGKPVTVAQAINDYEAGLKARGGDVDNAARIRFHLPDALAAKTVSLLTVRDLRQWRDGLIKHGLAPASVNRTARVLKAAFTAAAEADERIVNQRVWKLGLAHIPHTSGARNVVLSEPEVRAVIVGAYEVGPGFGLLVEVAAVTGARVSQLARLEVGDLQADRPDPRLMMPSSRKGRGQKRITRRPVPIPSDLAMRLRATARGRSDRAPLLTRPSDGGRWLESNHTRLFQAAVANAKIDPATTIYALRHTSITRQLIANVPVRIVAALHDTSVMYIEATYSDRITDFSDALSRRTLLDVSQPIAGNVVPLARKA